MEWSGIDTVVPLGTETEGWSITSYTMDYGACNRITRA